MRSNGQKEKKLILAVACFDLKSDLKWVYSWYIYIIRGISYTESTFKKESDRMLSIMQAL